MREYVERQQPGQFSFGVRRVTSVRSASSKTRRRYALREHACPRPWFAIMTRSTTVAVDTHVIVALTGMAHAQDAGPVKIGVLADMSGTYADIGGQGSVEAVKMAIEDF
eukprot:gene11542-15418_t